MSATKSDSYIPYSAYPIVRPSPESERLIDFRELVTGRNPSLPVRCARLGLWFLSLPYGLAAAAKNWSYDLGWKKPFRSPLPVVSVGNLSVGGTGKSPVVLWLANWIRSRAPQGAGDDRVRVAILSRGYGQLDHGQNDEALEMELLLPDVPHLQHWDRVASAKLAEEELDMQLLVLDDGFQHRRMARDLDIVLLDSSDSPAARRLLPCGLLRESLANLGRADVVMLTRVDQAVPAELNRLRQTVRRLAPHAIHAEACHRPSRLHSFPDQSFSLDVLQGKQVLAFCAIGNPTSFFKSLETAGAQLIGRRTWPDHHGYSAQDVEVLAGWCAEHPAADMLVCSMKDWVKVQTPQIAGVALHALAVELEIQEGNVELEARLSDLLQNIQRQQRTTRP